MIRIFSIIPRNSYGVKNAFFWQLCFAKILGECQNRSLYFCTHLSAKMGVSIHCTQIEKSISNFRNSFWKPRFWHPISDFGNHPDPEAPLLVVLRGDTTSRGAHFLAITPVPDAFVKFRTRRRRRGPCCGASVGTTGSAPCAVASRPWSVVRGLCWNHRFRPLCRCEPPNVSAEKRSFKSKFHVRICEKIRFLAGKECRLHLKERYF